MLNLECCISARGSPTPGRVSHFRAPPVAAEALAHLGVDGVTRLADGQDAARIRRRFTDACAAFGTEVAEDNGRLVTACL